MSYMLTFTGNSSFLTTDYSPPIELDKNENYEMGLVDLQGYNSIPNIHSHNNMFYYDDKVIEIPPGSYEVEDIERYLKEAVGDAVTLQINANTNTLKCEIKCTVIINCEPSDSVCRMLGFNKRKLDANKKHESDNSVNILSVETIYIKCNITNGSYHNNEISHTLFHFSPNLPPGYKIVIHPMNVIYLPINCQTISNITLVLVDQTGKLVNFRGENITIGLHLKKI